ncbi:MAG: hypothetical protein V5A59_07005 [Bacteroidales bacterium]
MELIKYKKTAIMANSGEGTKEGTGKRGRAGNPGISGILNFNPNNS